MNIHLRSNQVEKKNIPSACQIMTSALQVGNKKLGCECEGHSFNNSN
jgi:hypothetical protein